MTKECKQCSKSFSWWPHATGGRVQIYCSKQCLSIAHRKPIAVPVDVRRICLACDKEYKPRYKKQQYCSKLCHPYKTHSDNKYYQSKEWKIIRATFIESYTVINGINISNKYCIECYIKQNRLNDMYAVDHKVRLKDGGDHSFDNLQSLCKHHHQSKSATEGNVRYGRGRNEV